MIIKIFIYFLTVVVLSIAIVHQQSRIDKLKLAEITTLASFQTELIRVVEDERDKCSKTNIDNLSDNSVRDKLYSSGWLKD